jgi:tyrosine-protein kinase Etk/Wzc
MQDELDVLSKQLYSWPRLLRLVSELHLVKDTSSPLQIHDFIEGFKKRIKLEFATKDLIKISYRDGNPDTAYKVVTNIVQGIINDSAKQKREDAQNAIVFFTEQLNIYKAKLDTSEWNFSASKVESDLRLALNRKELLEAKMKQIQKMIPSQETREQNPLLVKLRLQLADMQEQEAKLMIDGKADNPWIAELKKRSNAIAQKISEEQENNTVKESITLMNPLYLQTEQDLKQSDIEVDYLRKRKAELEVQDSAVVKPVREDELATLERNKKVDEDIYQLLLRQMESAYVSQRLQESDKDEKFRIVEEARMPLFPSWPNKPAVLLIGLLSGLAVGVGLVLIVERVDKSFITVEEAGENLPEPVIGSISNMTINFAQEKPFLGRLLARLRETKIFSFLDIVPSWPINKASSALSPYLITHNDPLSKVSEEFRVLRTNIMNKAARGALKAVMITSTLKEEGKSLTSSNLAISMANNGLKTLLIDCDLRRGTVNKLFDVRRSPGLSDLIKVPIEVDPVLVKTPVAGLTLLPRGRAIVNPAELLDSVNFVKLLEGLKKRFDLILLDAPPVLNLPDSCIIGKHVDLSFMVVQMEHTQRADVINAYSALRKCNIAIGGFVLTKVHNYMPKYMYDSYYGEDIYGEPMTAQGEI